MGPANFVNGIALVTTAARLLVPAAGEVIASDTVESPQQSVSICQAINDPGSIGGDLGNLVNALASAASQAPRHGIGMNGGVEKITADVFGCGEMELTGKFLSTLPAAVALYYEQSDISSMISNARSYPGGDPSNEIRSAVVVALSMTEKGRKILSDHGINGNINDGAQLLMAVNRFDGKGHDIIPLQDAYYLRTALQNGRIVDATAYNEKAMWYYQQVMSSPILRATMTRISIREWTHRHGAQSYWVQMGGRINYYPDHPSKIFNSGKWSSSAYGKYQWLTKTWNDFSKKFLNAPGMDPVSQELGAPVLMREKRSCFDLVRAGDRNSLTSALSELGCEWAGVPNSLARSGCISGQNPAESGQAFIDAVFSTHLQEAENMQDQAFKTLSSAGHLGPYLIVPAFNFPAGSVVKLHTSSGIVEVQGPIAIPTSNLGDWAQNNNWSDTRAGEYTPGNGSIPMSYVKWINEPDMRPVVNVPQDIVAAPEDYVLSGGASSAPGSVPAMQLDDTAETLGVIDQTRVSSYGKFDVEYDDLMTAFIKSDTEVTLNIRSMNMETIIHQDNMFKIALGKNLEVEGDSLSLIGWGNQFNLEVNQNSAVLQLPQSEGYFGIGLIYETNGISYILNTKTIFESPALRGEFTFFELDLPTITDDNMQNLDIAAVELSWKMYQETFGIVYNPEEIVERKAEWERYSRDTNHPANFFYVEAVGMLANTPIFGYNDSGEIIALEHVTQNMLLPVQTYESNIDYYQEVIP